MSELTVTRAFLAATKTHLNDAVRTRLTATAEADRVVLEFDHWASNDPDRCPPWDAVIAAREVADKARRAVADRGREVAAAKAEFVAAVDAREVELLAAALDETAVHAARIEIDALRGEIR